MPGESQWMSWMNRSLANWRRRVGLRAGTDFAGTEQRIRDGAVLAAGDLWLVACSAILASIGLDLDSAAVIIGAMLISPLMGPILAIGLALGISDRRLLWSAVRELAVAFPEIGGITLAALPDALARKGPQQLPALLISFRRGTSHADVQRVLARANAFLVERLPKDTIGVRER